MAELKELEEEFNQVNVSIQKVNPLIFHRLNNLDLKARLKWRRK